MSPSWITAGIAIGALLVNLGINLSALQQIKETVRRMGDEQDRSQEKMYNHDARIAVLEDDLRRRRHSDET